MKRIESIEELKKTASNKDGRLIGYFIVLGGGLLRSSKEIVYYPETCTFDVHNLIDGTFLENISESELRNKTNIVDAIINKAFYQDSDYS